MNFKTLLFQMNSNLTFYFLPKAIPFDLEGSMNIFNALVNDWKHTLSLHLKPVGRAPDAMIIRSLPSGVTMVHHIAWSFDIWLSIHYT